MTTTQLTADAFSPPNWALHEVRDGHWVETARFARSERGAHMILGCARNIRASI